jgi:hypothetical protein
MKAICLYSTKSDYSFHTILLLEEGQTPEEVIEKYADENFDEEGKRWFLNERGMEYFFVHPFLADMAEVERLHGSDTLAYMGSHLLMNISARFTVPEDFEVSKEDYEVFTSLVTVDEKHVIDYWE